MFWRATDRASRWNYRSSKSDRKRPSRDERTKSKSILWLGAGNIVADTTGQLSGGTVEHALRPYLPSPRLSAHQREMRSALKKPKKPRPARTRNSSPRSCRARDPIVVVVDHRFGRGKERSFTFSPCTLFWTTPGFSSRKEEGPASHTGTRPNRGRFLGIHHPPGESTQVKLTATIAGAVGIILGCLCGCFPLIFVKPPEARGAAPASGAPGASDSGEERAGNSRP